MVLKAKKKKKREKNVRSLRSRFRSQKLRAPNLNYFGPDVYRFSFLVFSFLVPGSIRKVFRVYNTYRVKSIKNTFTKIIVNARLSRDGLKTDAGHKAIQIKSSDRI